MPENKSKKSSVYVSQVILPYTLELYGAPGQLHLSGTERKKRKKKPFIGWYLRGIFGDNSFHHSEPFGKERIFKLMRKRQFCDNATLFLGEHTAHLSSLIRHPASSEHGLGNAAQIGAR